MFQGLIAFWQSLASFMTPESIFYALAASLVGVVIGALPGLTATMGVALMTTLTIKLPAAQALLILICTYVGAIYGGSRSAILLNIPGTPASAASCLDGYALARQGHAGRAMGIATTGSVMGTLIGMFFLALFTPLLGDLALKFGAYEFFWLAVFGVIVSATLTGGDPLKGWIAGFAGLFIATIGQDGIHAYERRMVRQYWNTSRILGITVSNGLIFTGGRFSCMATRISAKPNAPTSAGTSEKPPARSRVPNEKRS